MGEILSTTIGDLHMFRFIDAVSIGQLSLHALILHPSDRIFSAQACSYVA
jgi:hypothetical protein